MDVPPWPAARPAWSSLPLPAKLFRIAHAAWSVVSTAALLDVWWCAVTGRRDRWLAASVGWLLTEGVALAIGRGDCPMGPVQRQLGDPVPLFELVLPPRAAKAAVPVLLVVTLAGLAGLVVGPRRAPRALRPGVNMSSGPRPRARRRVTSRAPVRPRPRAGPTPAGEDRPVP